MKIVKGVMMRKCSYLLLGLSVFFFGLIYSAQVNGDDASTPDPTTYTETPASTDEIDTKTPNLIGTFTPEPPTGYCSIVLAGQDFHISGGSGGVKNHPTIPSIDLPTVISNLNMVMQQNGFVEGNKEVAILIVDDFRGNNLASGATTDLSHGNMVIDHIQDVMYEFNNSSGYGANISVYAVPAQGYDIAEITANVQNQISYLYHTRQINRFVVNMSFSILPCATVQDFENWLVNNPGADFHQYYDDVVAAQAQDFDVWIQAQAESVESLTNNPLRSFITSIVNPDIPTFFSQIVEQGGSITFVASAGNFGDVAPFQFYPAGWTTVIGVGGSEGDVIDSPTPWTYSNLGDVMFPSAWYEYRGQQIWYAGTSFAAPLFSVIAALYATNDPINCPFVDNGKVLANTGYPLPFYEIVNTPC